jgi:hypothetical protein
MNIQFMNFEKEKRKYQEKIGTEKYRQQWGLDICKLDNGQIRMYDVWPPEDRISHCELDIYCGIQTRC